MEKWQKEFIIKNLPELILDTNFNAVVKAKLQANNILSQTDQDELVSSPNLFKSISVECLSNKL